jgi:hypothetical protein
MAGGLVAVMVAITVMPTIRIQAILAIIREVDIIQAIVLGVVIVGEARMELLVVVEELVMVVEELVVVVEELVMVVEELVVVFIVVVVVVVNNFIYDNVLYLRLIHKLL